MNATMSVFARCLVAACAEAVKPRMIAIAMAAAVAVAAPAAAQADEYPDVSIGQQSPAMNGAENNFEAGKWVGGVVGAGAGAAVAALAGANKYFTAAAAVLGGIGGAKIGESVANNQAAIPGQVVSAHEVVGEAQPRGLEGAHGLERSAFFPQNVGRTDLPRMSGDALRSYDRLAVTAAAYRLLVQMSHADYSMAREQLVLSPRDVQASRQVLAAKKSLESDIAGLNIAIADFSNATNVLRQRYGGNNFGGYQALAVSVSAPASVRAREIEPDRPIYPFAEELALQIKSGDVARMTAAAPGYASGGEIMRSAVARQGTLMGRSGNSGSASADESLRRLGMRQ